MTDMKTYGFALMAAAALGLVGCSSAGKRLGLTKTTPNEFNILTKAPLVIPPEYNLRPPKLGEASAENNYTQEAARNALIGDIDDAQPSSGEVALMTAAGVGRADQEIRIVLDGDNAVERKTSGFSDRVLFWKDGKAVKSDGTPLSAEEEANRLRAINAATGGGEVTISKAPPRAKLPGL